MDQTKPITSWKSGLPETPCGKGSQVENTEIIRLWLPEVIDEYAIESIADVGCGDQNWIHHCLPDEIDYVGYDIMPRRQDVKTFNVAREVLPIGYDLVTCIYVLNHLRPDEAERALKLLKMSGSKYLLMSYSSHDEYALPETFKFCESVHHKTNVRTTGKMEWRYGLWKI